MTDRAATFVLGAQDPEMREIERVLAADGRAFVHAARGRRRVDARSAYDADGVVRVGADLVPRQALLLPKAPVVFVECRLPGRVPQRRIDHHHPGDPGFDAGPERYLEGSSLGQLLALLGREPTPLQRLLAAGDHCLTAAYQGACEGVDPDELLALRAAWQARTSGRTLTAVIEGLLDAAGRARARFDARTGEARFLDPTEVPRDLPEGAARAGVPVRYRAWTPDGGLKEMFKGGSPAAVERFMAEHRAAGRPVYGNPLRGYAGTYHAGSGTP